MLLFEFVVDGPPVSQQTRRRDRYHDWKRRVREAAERYWPSGQPPFDGDLRLTIYYFFEGAATDVDNVPKPIHDALVGLVFQDDVQITESVIRRRNLAGEFAVTSMTTVLADGLDSGREFIYVAVSRPPASGELPHL
jgi:crossover junction endodeoxyribonuclease RusA